MAIATKPNAMDWASAAIPADKAYPSGSEAGGFLFEEVLTYSEVNGLFARISETIGWVRTVLGDKGQFNLITDTDDDYILRIEHDGTGGGAAQSEVEADRLTAGDVKLQREASANAADGVLETADGSGGTYQETQLKSGSFRPTETAPSGSGALTRSEALYQPNLIKAAGRISFEADGSDDLVMTLESGYNIDGATLTWIGASNTIQVELEDNMPFGALGIVICKITEPGLGLIDPFLVSGSLVTLTTPDTLEFQIYRLEDPAGSSGTPIATTRVQENIVTEPAGADLDTENLILDFIVL